jgi:hypothetical protein
MRASSRKTRYEGTRLGGVAAGLQRDGKSRANSHTEQKLN